MPIDASKDLSWQSDCLLPVSLLEERIQTIPSEYVDKFQRIFQRIYRTDDLSSLHLSDHYPLDTMIPAIYHARVQAKMEKGSGKIGRNVIKSQNKHWNQNEHFKEFLRVYKEFLRDFIVPQFEEYGGILYQATPTLRVVFPGSVAPVKPHKDADYWHDSNEINFWVPLVPVYGANSLWSESEPGKGDFHSFDIDGSRGELMRFYGNRCQHYTTDNTTSTTRISFDFRVIPASLFRLNSRQNQNKSIPEVTDDEIDTTEEVKNSASRGTKRKLSESGITDIRDSVCSNDEASHNYGDDEQVKKLALRGARPLLEGKYYQRMMCQSVVISSDRIEDQESRSDK